MKLLEEVLLRLLVVELWEHFSIVTKVVDECLKCNAISVEEYLVIYHLELVHVREHLSEQRVWHRSEHVLLGLNVHITTDVETDDLTLHVDKIFDHLLVLLPGLTLNLDQSILLIHSVLHVNVPLLEVAQVRLQLPLRLLEVNDFLLEFHVHVRYGLLERLLDFTQALTPDHARLRHLWNQSDVEILWELAHEVEPVQVVWVLSYPISNTCVRWWFHLRQFLGGGASAGDTVIIGAVGVRLGLLALSGGGIGWSFFGSVRWGSISWWFVSHIY